MFKNIQYNPRKQGYVLKLWEVVSFQVIKNLD